MHINLSRNLVEFVPENADETAKLQTVWRLLVDCNNDSRKLTPVGEFVPAKSKDKGATFVIEGRSVPQLPEFPEVIVPTDCKVYCFICNRILDLRGGNRVPPCCGKLMEIMD